MISSDYKVKFLKNNFVSPKLGTTGLIQAQNEFPSNAFLEIAYNNSLRHFLTSSRSKPTKKMGEGAQI